MLSKNQLTKFHVASHDITNAKYMFGTDLVGVRVETRMKINKSDSFTPQKGKGNNSSATPDNAKVCPMLN